MARLLATTEICLTGAWVFRWGNAKQPFVAWLLLWRFDCWMRDRQRAVCSIRGIPFVGSPWVNPWHGNNGLSKHGVIVPSATKWHCHESKTRTTSLSINTPKSFMWSMMQSLRNQPIKILSIQEMTMGFTIPALSIGVVMYLFFHFLLRGVFV